jgi:hypothetical protein
MIGVAVMLWAVWKMAADPMSIPRKVVAVVVMIIFIGLLASMSIATELITIDNRHLTIRRELFGIGFSKKFRLRSISNLRYEPTPLAANRGPLQSIVFNVLEDMIGVLYRFGSELGEEDAQQIIQYSEDYKSRAG